MQDRLHRLTRTRQWPDDKKRRFIKAWESGIRHADLSERFGIGPNAIYFIAKELGLKPRRGRVELQ